MKRKTDVVVVGGGYFGTSIAYELSKRNVKAVLIEKTELGSGASGANFGNIQVQDAEPGISLELSLQSFRLWANMERLLGVDLEYRQMGSLIAAASPEEMEDLHNMLRIKQKQGLRAKLLKAQELNSVEPFLSTASIAGGQLNIEASINPFKLMFGLAKRAKEMGTVIMEHTQVEDFIVEQGVVKGVTTSKGEIISELVILTVGAWTRQLCYKLGMDIPVEYVYAEAFVTEALPPCLNNYFSLAAFFDEAHGKKSFTTSLCCKQTIAGNLLVGETSYPGDVQVVEAKLKTCSDAHMHDIARQLKKFFPKLLNSTVIRSWRTASPFTKSYRPVFGFAGPEGLFIAAGFKSSVIMIPIISQIAADLVTKGTANYDLTGYSII